MSTMLAIRRLAPFAAVALVALGGCGSDDDGASDAGSGMTDAATTTPLPSSDDRPATETDASTSAKPAAAKRTGRLVKVVDSQFGRVLADRKGEAFYLFDKERTERSECYGDCATAWPPVLTKGRPRAGRGTTQSKLGTTKRRDGTLQVTYAGHPLYYYVHDSPGNILCQNVDEFGGLWLVVKPSGRPVR